MNKVLALATHQSRLGALTLHRTLPVYEDGINDYQCRTKPHFAISILSLHHWQLATHEAGCDLPWYERRANILVPNFAMNEQDIGRQLKIGSCVLQCEAETDPCARMDLLCKGLKSALTPDWRGGGRFSIVQAGEIQIDDEFEWIS